MKYRVLLAVAATLFFPILVSACGCVPSCDEYFGKAKQCVLERLNRSAAVFTGKVTSIEQQKDNPALFKAVFAVATSWKGISSETVDVYYYDLIGSGCPFSLKVGSTYSFFALSVESKLYAGECDSAAGYERYLPKGKRWRTRNK